MPYPMPELPPRQLTAQELQHLRQEFPQMTQNNTLRIGPPTNQYNCMAWSVGVTNAWLWPGANKFKEFYTQYGAHLVANGGIVAFGFALLDMKHGATNLQIPNYGRHWTSKLGVNPLVLHSLDALSGSGSIYGDPLQYYTPQPPLAESWIGEEIIMYQLTEAEISTLQDRINRLSQDVREQFTRAYDRWKQTWSQPAILASSDPQVRARSKEFDDLVAMGQVIVPLLIREMSVEHDFFALQAVEKLVPPDIVFRPAIGDPEFLGGEQLRAHMTARRWLAS